MPAIVRRTISPRPPPCRAHRTSKSGLEDRLEKIDVHGPHLDGPGRGRRAARGPFKCGVERLEVHEHEASKLLLGLGERAVLDITLAALHPDRRGVVGALERGATDVSTRRDQCPEIRAPGRDVGFGLRGTSGREIGWSLIDQHYVPHGRTLLARGRQEWARTLR